MKDSVGECIGRLQELLFSWSVLPDRFGAAFVDLHVHRTAWVYVGSQIDLWELRLKKTRRRLNVMFGNSMLEFNNQCINEQKVFLEHTKKKRIFDQLDVDFVLNFIFALVAQQSEWAKWHKGGKLGYSQSSGQWGDCERMQPGYLMGPSNCHRNAKKKKKSWGVNFWDKQPERDSLISQRTARKKSQSKATNTPFIYI